MKIDTFRFALAVGFSFAVAWVACSLMVAVMPDVMATVTGHMIHADLSEFEWEMGLYPVVSGLVAWTMLAIAMGWVAACTYNALISANTASGEAP